MILLNPGPVNISPAVRRALLRPDICHREPEFAALQADVRAGTLAVYGLDERGWTSVVLTGSGTTAVEAMITSLVPPSRPVLVIENGVYGERMSSILDAFGMPHVALRLPYGAAIDPAAVGRALDDDPEIRQVAVVHHETTTGRLNDLASIGAVCRDRRVEMLVDAVSSFGAEAIDFEAWGVTACAVSSNKCLHGVPGTAFVLTRRAALATARFPARSVSLDLRGHERAQATGGTLFTPAVHGLYAIDAALREHVDEGGWSARRDRYRALAARVRDGLARLGIESLLPARASSCALTAYHLPDGVAYATLHDGLKRRGFVIYAGQAALAERIFRVSTMGAVTGEDIDRFIDAVGAEVCSSRPMTFEATN